MSIFLTQRQYIQCIRHHKMEHDLDLGSSLGHVHIDCFCAGRCYFDPYSRIYDTACEDTLAQFSLAADEVTTVAMATFSPPPVTPSVHVYDLVEVKGICMKYC